MVESQKEAESQIELLTKMFNTFINKSKNLDANSAIVFREPMCDILSRAVHQINTYEETQKVDELISGCFKDN